MLLDGKVAIVTGAGRGLGRAYAHALAESGAVVAVADIDVDRAGRVVAEIGGQAREALAVEVDVADEASTLGMAEQVNARFGKIDILVNNAGIYPLHEWQDISVAEWDRVFAVNVRGTFLCSRAVYSAMRARGAGKIINIASSVIFNPIRNAHYVASKAAVVGLTRELARELGGDNIAVNAICPGLTRADDIPGAQPPAMVEQIVNGQCFKRVERPSDLVGTVVFLASSASDFITGQTIAVDGGWTMH
jgi:3-oxoacyl-[acyl-carrier protein] reductase